jgi:MFS family permease
MDQKGRLMSASRSVQSNQEAAKTSQPVVLPATFRALRHYNYRLWFFGQTISLVGTWMQTMAQQVLVYRLTGSAAALGVISFIGLIPLIPLSFWGGSLTDRFPKRTLIMATQVTMLVLALSLAGLTLSGIVQLWHVYLFAFLLGAANAIDLPARQAFTIDMVEGKEDLTNAIGLNSAMFNGARAIGPALAGLVVAALGEGLAFFLNGLSFIAVIISLSMMRNLPHSSAAAADGPSTLEHMAQGLHFIRSQKTLIILISLVAVSAFLSMPYSTLMPVFASQVLGESAAPVVAAICGGGRMITQCQTPDALPLGLLLTMVGLGALAGALCVASLSNRARRGLLLTAGNLAFPALLLIFAASRSFPLSLVIVLLVGFSFVWQNALANTLLQIITPDAVRGRVMGLYTMTFQGMMRIGGLQAGFMSDWLGAPVTVGLGAAISLAYGLYVMVRYPPVRKL